jgi:hypothetical protein
MSKVTNMAAWKQRRADRLLGRVQALQAEGHCLSAALDIAGHEAGILELEKRPPRTRYDQMVREFLKGERG